jgi:ABC-2 type transport system permease protein
VLILATARLFVDYGIAHPLWMLWFLVLTAVIFSLFGFVLGIWADGFETLQVVPLLIITPLTFLGGSFYSIGMLPPIWQKVALFNPVVYLISGFRWSFYGLADVGVGISVGMTLAFPGVPHRRMVDLQDRVSAEELRVNGGQHRAVVRHG